jgi:hypothetical protein
MLSKIYLYNKGEISENQLSDSLQGWCAYARWANSYNLMKKLCFKINKEVKNEAKG